MKNTSLVLTLFLVLSACGTNSGTGRSPEATAVIDGDWESPCVPGSFFPFSLRMSISAGSARVETVLYEDSNCTLKEEIVIIDGAYKLGKVYGPDTMTEIDMVMLRAFLTPLTDKATDRNNSSGSPCAGKYVKGVALEYTACLSTPEPASFSGVKIVDGKLCSANHRGPNERGDSANSRPQTLSTEGCLTRVK